MNLQLDSISFQREGNAILKDISLTAALGQSIAVIGPSGAGKSTLLRIIAGLETPTCGRIDWRDQRVNNPQIRVPAHQRCVGWVPQYPSLIPGQRVLDQIEYPLRIRRLNSAERRRRVHALSQVFGIPRDLLDRHAAELSGGELQRVTLARALACNPELLLLDEPVNQIDAPQREQVLQALSDYLAPRRIVTLYVTHHAQEAWLLANQTVVLWQGGVVQAGTAAEIYRHPASTAVAHLTGPCNEVSVEVAARLIQMDQPVEGHSTDILLWRPEDLALVAHPDGPWQVWENRFETGRYRIRLCADTTELIVWHDHSCAPGQQVCIHARRFPATPA